MRHLISLSNAVDHHLLRRLWQMLGRLYSRWLTARYVDEPTTSEAFRFSGRPLRVRIAKAPSARLTIDGALEILPWMAGRQPIAVQLDEQATLSIGPDCRIGDAVAIAVLRSGALSLFAGGKGVITCHARIVAHEHVVIGGRSLVSWDTLITDGDFHQYGTSVAVQPVEIGARTWIAHGASVLKGARIGTGSVVAAKALVLAGEYPERSTLAGTPASVVRHGTTTWEP